LFSNEQGHIRIYSSKKGTLKPAYYDKRSEKEHKKYLDVGLGSNRFRPKIEKTFLYFRYLVTIDEDNK
jgi:hypothetical protein